MKPQQAVAALSALAHSHRMGICRMLIEAGPEGLSAGTIALRLDLPPSSLTFHLQNLQRAGLVTQQRLSRRLVYAVGFDAMNALVGFLTAKCRVQNPSPARCDTDWTPDPRGRPITPD